MIGLQFQFDVFLVLDYFRLLWWRSGASLSLCSLFPSCPRLLLLLMEKALFHLTLRGHHPAATCFFLEPPEIDLLEETDMGAGTKENADIASRGGALFEAGLDYRADPKNYDWKAAIADSLQNRKAKEAKHEQGVQDLANAVNAAEDGAGLDYSTPKDGHCLFHALAAGGLLSDIPESLTIDELRQIALQTATLQQLETAAIGTGEQGLTIEQYVRGMRRGLYGDNLIISLLASFFSA